MLDKILAIRFDRAVSSGKTEPCLFTCVNAVDDDSEVEVVAKLSHGCNLKAGALAIEALAAIFAADLNLPVPQPFIVDMSPELIDTIPDPKVATAAKQSCRYAFGSQKLPSGFLVWPHSKEIPSDLVAQAAEIFAFDEFIINGDRRPDNPNCLYNGTEFAIFDHELCFLKYIGYLAPWDAGFVEARRAPPVPHLFLRQLQGMEVDLAPLGTRLAAITDERINEYANCLPEEWCSEQPCVKSALTQIRELRDNADSAISAVMEVLK